MHHIGALILGVFFGGGTILAVGSVLTSVKRSAPLPRSKYAIGPVIDQNELLPGAEFEETPELALPSPEIQAAESADLPQPQPADTSRKGKRRKKPRATVPRKRLKEESHRESPRASRKNRKNQTN